MVVVAVGVLLIVFAFLTASISLQSPYFIDRILQVLDQAQYGFLALVYAIVGLCVIYALGAGCASKIHRLSVDVHIRVQIH